MAFYTCLPSVYDGSFGSGAWNSTTVANIQAQDALYIFASQPNRGAIYSLDQPPAASAVASGTLFYRGRWAVGAINVNCYLYDGTTALTTLTCVLTSSNANYTKSYACPASAVGNLKIRLLNGSAAVAECRCDQTYYSMTYTPTGGCLLTWGFLGPLLGAAIDFAQFLKACDLLARVKGLYYDYQERLVLWREFQQMRRAVWL